MEVIMKHLIKICIIVSLFWNIDIYGQNPTIFFHWLTMDNGLSHNSVNKAIEDKSGFIWFATRDGLNRFDGHSFKIFLPTKNQKGESAHINYIVSLLEDDSGKIWVGTSAGVYIFDPDQESFKLFDHKTKDGLAITGKITDLGKGKNNEIWIADYSHGLFNYSPKSCTLKCYNTTNGTLNSDDIMTICCDNDGTVWAGTLGLNVGGLNRYDEKTDRFIFNESYFVGGVNKIAESGTNNLLIGLPKDGVYYYNRVTGKAEQLPISSGNDLFVNDILADNNFIWIGASDGLYSYNAKTQKSEHFEANLTKTNSLSSNDVTSLLKDRKGGLWFCTLSRGINYLPYNYKDFELFPSSYDVNFKDGQIKTFAEDNTGNIWFATNKGICVFDPKNQHFIPSPIKDIKLSGDNITWLLIDNDTLWIGYFGKGLDRINLSTHKIERYTANKSILNSLNDDSIMSLCKDEEGNMIIGTTKGACLLNADNHEFKPLIPRMKNELISDIIEDKDFNIWLASYGNGIHIMNPRTHSWNHITDSLNNFRRLNSNYVTGLFKDSKQKIWVETEDDGLCRIDSENGETTAYTTENGLPSNIIQKVLEDGSGKIWISTNNGLSCFNPKLESFTNYSFSGGPISNQFLHNSGLKGRDGYIYFGTAEGFIRFNPENIKLASKSAPIIFTDLFISNQAVPIGIKGSPLKHSIVYSDKIVLSHKQNSIRLSFAELDFQYSQAKKFYYRLDHYDGKWLIANDNQIYYSNLPSGKYRLTIADSENIDNPGKAGIKQLIIVVKPSIWASWWAMLIYLALSTYLCYLGVISFKKKQNEKRRHQLEEQKASEEKAIYDSKLAFFTGLAHEIKTPLSLISAPFEILSSPTATEEDKSSCMDVMKENIQRLTELTRQMLDISIIEQDGFIVNKTPTDINNIIENILKSFNLTFGQNGIHLEKKLCEPHVIANVDKEMMTKIFSNLLGNAVKYCDTAIRITLESKDGNVCLAVWNDGNKIAPEFREKVFEIFYQVPGSQKRGGVGVGLSLVKNFVEIHNGTVFVNPDTETGTEFLVQIPIGDISRKEETDNAEIPAEEYAAALSDAGKLTLMVVDDDKSMIRFLKKILSKQYHVLTANDGSAAISMLKQNPTDLVLSDVMMSDIDGISLCKVIKNHDEFKNIPVILLTAKTDHKSKLEGMEAGADAYLEKPFSTELLLAQINNILKNKRNYKQSVIASALNRISTTEYSAKGEQFLAKLYEVINNNLAEPGLDISFLADAMHISRSNLYRKIEEATKKSPGELIKDIRLEKAAEYLIQSDLRIGEIGNIVGYASSSYFAKAFLKKFGILPKEYASSHAKKSDNE